jgi:hypothetical protein
VAASVQDDDRLPGVRLRLMAWARAAALLLPIFATLACGSPPPALPGGYSVTYGDRGKAWLANPDKTLAHGALIKQLFADDRHILLITFATTYGGEVAGPRPLDGNCYVALLIDGPRQRTRQIHLAQARRLSRKMTLVESYERGCLPGTPT